jgi:hypothetical protein
MLQQVQFSTLAGFGFALGMALYGAIQHYTTLVITSLLRRKS